MHGSYWIIDINEPDVTVFKAYFMQDNQIQIHDILHVAPCSPELLADLY